MPKTRPPPPKRAAQYGVKHYTWLCLNPKEGEDRALAREVLRRIPKFLDAPNVLGIGEIGLNRVTRNELATFRDHVDLALEHGQLIHIHTPHLEDKYKGTRTIVEALQSSASGTPERGLEPLEEALRAAAPGRLRRPFLVDATELRSLLHRRVEDGSAVPVFALDLLQRMSGSGVDELAARRAVVDHLTVREQTILRYLASTLSNSEIANELYLSVNTVKTHQRTIYRKLGAAGRREAVQRARTLRLL